MAESDKYFQSNQKLWDGWTKLHQKSEMYDVEGFRQGKSSLNFIELEELGSVEGKSMLHLQCHFGMDSISWSKLGAEVTAVDFSESAIEVANSLNSELSQSVTFIQSNIYDLKDKIDRHFDIVFTSYGVISWLPDIDRWAETIAHFLKKGGIFYMVEFHPIAWIFDDDAKIRYPYFHHAKPDRDISEGSYAEREAGFSQEYFNWNHSMSDIINALLRHGLEIKFLNEFPFSVYDCFENSVQDKDGWWRFDLPEDSIPMMFSIKTIKS